MAGILATLILAGMKALSGTPTKPPYKPRNQKLSLCWFAVPPDKIHEFQAQHLEAMTLRELIGQLRSNEYDAVLIPDVRRQASEFARKSPDDHAIFVEVE